MSWIEKKFQRRTRRYLAAAESGSDTAMMFGWLKVIFDEELYDKAFVENWTVGFDELRARVDEFPLERVAELTGCDAEMIAEAARLYATAGPSIIPWTPITDMQRNSTSGIRLQSILRAVCGYLDVPGGETLQGFNPDIIPESEIRNAPCAERRPKAQTIGQRRPSGFHLSRAGGLSRADETGVWGYEYANQVTGCFMANPSAVFRAMAGRAIRSKHSSFSAIIR